MIPWCHYDSAERQDQFLAHDVNWVERQTNCQENQTFVHKPSWSRKKWCDRCLEVSKSSPSQNLCQKSMIFAIIQVSSILPPNNKKTDGTVRPKSVPGTIRSFFSTCFPTATTNDVCLHRICQPRGSQGECLGVVHLPGTWQLNPNGNPLCFGYFHGNNDVWHILKRKRHFHRKYSPFLFALLFVGVSSLNEIILNKQWGLSRHACSVTIWDYDIYSHASIHV